jgi:hypothetical protein
VVGYDAALRPRGRGSRPGRAVLEPFGRKSIFDFLLHRERFCSGRRDQDNHPAIIGRTLSRALPISRARLSPAETCEAASQTSRPALCSRDISFRAQSPSSNAVADEDVHSFKIAPKRVCVNDAMGAALSDSAIRNSVEAESAKSPNKQNAARLTNLRSEYESVSMGRGSPPGSRRS